jgi:predicted DNA-binding transcriptional regulator AlpA
MGELVGKLMTPAQVSEKTTVPEETLRWLRHKGRGPRSYKLGRRTVYKEEDVELWLKQNLTDDASFRPVA